MDKKLISNTVMYITNENAINMPYFTLLDGGTATLAKHPNTRKYL